MTCPYVHDQMLLLRKLCCMSFCRVGGYACPNETAFPVLVCHESCRICGVVHASIQLWSKQSCLRRILLKEKEDYLSRIWLWTYRLAIAWAVTSDCAHTGTSLHGHASKKFPFPPTEQNFLWLKNWNLEDFAETALKNNGGSPPMSGHAAHIHLKEGAVPKAKHSPIPVPFHLKEPVWQSLWEDVKRGITTPVSVGMPTDWCSTMVVTAKEEYDLGRRRTIYRAYDCKLTDTSLHWLWHLVVHIRVRHCMDIMAASASIILRIGTLPMVNILLAIFFQTCTTYK